MSFLAAEREALCDTFLSAGSAAPTLCTGWDAYDLAAHMWVRENQIGRRFVTMVHPRRSEEDLLRAAKRQHTFEDLVELLRAGPKGASPFRVKGLRSVLNTLELFIHHEDVRRAGSVPLPPRSLDEEAEKALLRALKQSAGLLFARAPFGVDLVTDDGKRISVKRNRKVGIQGPVGELLIYASGRGQVAQVELTGRPEDIEKVAASLGI
ncbi:MAG TPA: TIGR03085 family metal-binding protein [Actinomycetaceae bacterium]|nr:TIGR03085 family metal-binding protein [Actinomycetaceae bacterium]